jgi:hypothetical protein
MYEIFSKFINFLGIPIIIGALLAVPIWLAPTWLGNDIKKLEEALSIPVIDLGEDLETPPADTPILPDSGCDCLKGKCPCILIPIEPNPVKIIRNPDRAI